MRSARSARLSRLFIGATIITGLIGTTATSALAASAVTFGLIREENPHNGVQSTDVVFRDTDTITGTGDTSTGITVNLSSSSPAHTASLNFVPEAGGTIITGTYPLVGATPTALHAGMTLTLDGTVCDSGPALVHVNQLHFAGTDIDALSIGVEGTCPAAGLGEVHAQFAIAATTALKAVVTDPANTLAIGNVDVGDASTQQTVTFTNIGNTAIDMSTLAKGGRYPELYTFSETCAATLAPGASCDAKMIFKPTTYGLKEAAVVLAGDDISTEGLKKEVLVTGTGIVIDAPNDTPAHAIDVNPIPTSGAPFYSGVQLQNLDPSHGNCDTDDNAAVWYHLKSTTTKTFDLTTVDSDVATNIELYTGPVGAPVFVKCGVNIDANLRDKLTFSAAANVDYFIRVAREVPPPGDYAIVLKVSLGSPDTMVDVSGFMTSRGTFYPVVDGYRDTVDIRATRGETASASIAIYNSHGTKVRTLTVPSGDGPYSVTWNGRTSGGTLLAAGKYKIISTVTDTTGNKLSDTRYVTTSLKKLVTKTFTQTIDAAKYTQLLKSGTGSASKTSTAYTGGLKMTSGSNGTVAAVYSFSAPSAISYTTVTFTVIGKGATNTMSVGLQNWTVCTSYSTTCVTAIHAGPHSSGIASAAVSAPAATTIYSTIHRIRGYLFAPALPGTTRTIDARDVKITVTYKALG